MPVNRRDVLRWQFDLAWSLLELHLDELEPEDFLWEPARYCWTVRPGDDGMWVADFAETEPDPVPIPTIAWLTWHIGWWWTAATEHAQGQRPRGHDEVAWPGDGKTTVAWLRRLRVDWIAVLDRLTNADLDFSAQFPWPSDPGKTIAHMLAWVNSELMKNAAEIGQLRLLRAASFA